MRTSRLTPLIEDNYLSVGAHCSCVMADLSGAPDSRYYLEFIGLALIQSIKW